ncbi:MAG: twin-arginine translocase subunit TatC [Blastochloris sp.]|jgi:sec-independent protein translocase protein TatC|nr:twin-arginine translocase subunit TatC [Blastochloris sp.]
MKDESKPFLDHLEDLRWTIIKSVIALALSMGISLFFTDEILRLLEYPLKQAIEPTGKKVEDFLIMQNMMDPLTITIQTAISAGVILALPFILYFVGQFILPALSKRERNMILPTFTVGLILFLIGVIFCYFLILPQAIQVFIDWGTSMRRTFLMPQDLYLGFILQMLIAFGLSFELPLVIIILSKLGIVSKKMLREHRRHVIVFIIIFAACVTPTSDPFSLAMLAVPMYLLYEISILCAVWIEHKKAKQEAAEFDLIDSE